MPNDTILIDCDTQYDFVMPDGAWPVPGAQAISPSLERLTRYARMYDLRHLATTQSLSPGDPRFEANGGTEPAHCVAGTPGQRKVPAGRSPQSATIPNRPLPAGEVASLREAHKNLVLETSGPDLMSNPNAAALLTGVKGAFVYGVSGEGAVLTVVKALRGMGITVEVVHNATALRSTEPEAREEWLRTLESLGARAVRDLDVMTRFTTARHR